MWLEQSGDVKSEGTRSGAVFWGKCEVSFHTNEHEWGYTVNIRAKHHDTSSAVPEQGPGGSAALIYISPSLKTRVPKSNCS